MPQNKTRVRFVEPMLLLRTEKLPQGVDWLYELKLDGYRALAIKTGGKVHLRSRNDKDFTTRYPAIVKALAAMPDETVIDGEVVALDGDAEATLIHEREEALRRQIEACCPPPERPPICVEPPCPTPPPFELPPPKPQPPPSVGPTPTR